MQVASTEDVQAKMRATLEGDMEVLGLLQLLEGIQQIQQLLLAPTLLSYLHELDSVATCLITACMQGILELESKLFQQLLLDSRIPCWGSFPQTIDSFSILCAFVPSGL